jgi:hypothetical protein
MRQLTHEVTATVALLLSVVRGAATVITVPSRPRDVPSNITLIAGVTYEIHATGTWKDWYIECNASGYENSLMRPFDSLKRVPQARWFTLVCCVGDEAAQKKPSSAACTVIGEQGTIVVPKGGGRGGGAIAQMHCFANDAWSMYWNNFGEVRVQVSEIHR